MRRKWWIAVCLVSASMVVNAQHRRIGNPANHYSFAVTPEWSIAHPDFMITTRSGASLQESEIPPQKNPSLHQISKTAGMIALIGADYSATEDRFKLFGDDWEGLVTVFVEPRRNGRPGRHVLQLVAEHEGDFRLFYLALPSPLWLQQRQRYAAFLASLQFTR